MKGEHWTGIRRIQFKGTAGYLYCLYKNILKNILTIFIFLSFYLSADDENGEEDADTKVKSSPSNLDKENENTVNLLTTNNGKSLKFSI